MTLKEFLTRSFTWWNGQTWGTWLHTLRRGVLVGQDEFGNTYYKAIGHIIDPSIGAERRWVIYNGEADASKIPPGWRGWMTHTYDIPPTEQRYSPREWEKTHKPNMTGTPMAYRPPGSTSMSGERPAATGDYAPWSPDEWGGDRDVRQPNQHPGTHGLSGTAPQHG